MAIANDYKERLLRSSRLLNTHQTANALGVSERTIVRWRSQKINLDYLMVGQQARYEPEAIEAFKESQTIRVSSFPSDSHQKDNAT